MSTEKRIFISHASKDKKLADAFVDLLVLGLNIDSNEIFCTSLEGLGIPTGENFIEFIKEQIKDSEIVISLLSHNYYDSAFCLCELGASWVLSGEHYPIVIQPLRVSDIEAVLKNSQMRMIDSDSDLSELKDELEDVLDLTNVKTARWETKKDQFLKKLPKILAELPVPDIIPTEKYEGIKAKYDDLLQQMITLEEENEQQKEIIDELKSSKDQAEVRKIVKKYSTLDEQFDGIISEAKKSLKGLDSIVVEALYYYFRDEDLPLPSPYDEFRFEEIKSQMEYEFLCGSLGDDHEAGSVYVCTDNPKIEITIEALSELRRFVWKVTDEHSDDYEEKYEDFVLDYREEHGYNLSFTSRNFWEEHLDM
jgi:hypothetical protein